MPFCYNAILFTHKDCIIKRDLWAAALKILFPHSLLLTALLIPEPVNHFSKNQSAIQSPTSLDQRSLEPFTSSRHWYVH